MNVRNLIEFLVCNCDVTGILSISSAQEEEYEILLVLFVYRTYRHNSVSSSLF